MDVAVGEGTGVAVGVGVDVAVGSGVFVGVGVGVLVGAGVEVAVGSGVFVGVGVDVAVGAGVDVAVAVGGTGVGLSRWARTGPGVRLGNAFVAGCPGASAAGWRTAVGERPSPPPHATRASSVIITGIAAAYRARVDAAIIVDKRLILTRIIT